MEKLVKELRDAADTLKMVIAGYGFPLDTYVFDAALKAVEDEAAKGKPNFFPPAAK